MEACSHNKRKTKAVPAAIGAEGSMKKRKEDPSTESKAEVEASSKSGVSAEAAGKVHDAAVSAKFGGLARAENGKWILPDEDVQRILHLDPDRFPPVLRDSMVAKQNWIRRQYIDNDGVVLLDDDMAASRAERIKEMEDELMEMLEGVDLSEIANWELTDDQYSDFFDRDDDDEEGEEVLQPVHHQNQQS